MGSNISRVGVIHREFLQDFIDENRKLCKSEGIEIISISLPNRRNKYKYKTLCKRALKALAKKDIEALWIPNDNKLLKKEIIKGVWKPMVRKLKIPAVVGVEALAKPKLNLGTFAVLPDHFALGNQAAEMVFEIMENGWRIKEPRVEPPLAIYKIVNLRQVKKYFKIPSLQLKNVDKKLK